MSTKLNDALQKSRDIYEEEKEKFLDALAAFIETNRAVITHSDHYWFGMKVSYAGNGDKGNLYCSFSFGINATNWQEPFTLDLSETTAVKILENEYHAEIVDQPLDKNAKNSKLYNSITLPFISY